jgi:hypothetical protein
LTAARHWLCPAGVGVHERSRFADIVETARMDEIFKVSDGDALKRQVDATRPCDGPRGLPGNEQIWPPASLDWDLPLT